MQSLREDWTLWWWSFKDLFGEIIEFIIDTLLLIGFTLFWSFRKREKK